MSEAGRHPHLPVALALATCVVLVAGASSPGAVAMPSPTVDEVRRRIAALHEQAETATERYNAVRDDMAGLDVRLSAAGTKLAQQRRALARAREQIGHLAADTYKAGDLAGLSLFLSDDPDGYVGTNRVLMSLADRRAAAVDELLRDQQLVIASATDVEEQRQRLQQSRRQLEATRHEVERKLADAERELGRLTGDERAVLASQDDDRYRRGIVAQGVAVPRSGRLTCRDVLTGALEPRAAAVIRYACAQLGDPYRWGASGPDRFDCSGLTMAAWQQAGVSLPHNAALQARLGTEVALDDLRPGDLVFFHRPIGHNGIYLGNGMMIHAPRTGDVVKIAPVRYLGPVTAAVRF